MAQADSGKVGKPDRMYQDQLWMWLCAAAEVLESGGPNKMFWERLQGVEENCQKAGCLDPRGKLMCHQGHRDEWRIYSPMQKAWATIYADHKKHGKKTIDECLEVLLELRELRANELETVAAKAMGLLATEHISDVLNRLKPKPKRGRPGAMNKDRAKEIHRQVVELSKAEDIYQSEAVKRLSQSLKFRPENWDSIRIMATR